MSNILGLKTPSEPKPPIPSPAPMTFESVPERINALEAVLTLLVVKGSVFATSEELAKVQQAVRDAPLLNTPLGHEMDNLLDRLKSAVQRHEQRKPQDG